MSKGVLQENNPVDTELLCAALIGYSDDEEAVGFLAEHDIVISPAKLNVLRRRAEAPPCYSKPESADLSQQYQRRRAELAPAVEAKLADDMLSNAAKATLLESLCFERIQVLLEGNELRDPARVARDLSQIRTQAIDKRLALQGRPTTITSSRSMEEVLRQLESMNVVKRVDVEGDAIELELEA